MRPFALEQLLDEVAADEARWLRLRSSSFHLLRQRWLPSLGPYYPGVAFELAPDPGDRGEPDVKLGRSGGSAVGEDRRLVEAGVQVLARGALICPSCTLPIAPAPRIAPRADLRCGFCEHAAPAIEFLREDFVDVPANDVVLMARVV